MNKESAATHHIDIKTPKNHPSDKEGGIWARLHWSQNAGTYGHQVIIEYNAGNGFETYTTGGCGFCKLTAATEHFYSAVFGKRYDVGGDLSYACTGTKYHKGGNFYTMTLKQFEKIGKR